MSAGKQKLKADTTQRLQEIVEAAERAAASVIDDAEAQARRYLAEARREADRLAEGQVTELSDLVDSLLSQAISLRREAERLQATLEEARGRMDAGEGPEREPQRDLEPEAPRLRAVDGGGAAAESEAKRADAAGARLLATQLAVSGSSREEIATRLRSGFQIEDPKAILDAILGPEE
jgi:cell division septum initiation protein DivIVA